MKSMDKAAKLAMLSDGDSKYVDVLEGEAAEPCLYGYLCPFGGCYVSILAGPGTCEWRTACPWVTAPLMYTSYYII